MFVPESKKIINQFLRCILVLSGRVGSGRTGSGFPRLFFFFVNPSRVGYKAFFSAEKKKPAKKEKQCFVQKKKEKH